MQKLVDVKKGVEFMNFGTKVIYHLKKHKDDAMQFWYRHNSGSDFDVRELPEEYLGDDKYAVNMGDRDAHKRVILRAATNGFSFNSNRSSPSKGINKVSASVFEHGYAASVFEQGYAVIARRYGGDVLISIHESEEYATKVARKTIDIDPLRVEAAEVSYADNGNVRMWRSRPAS